ARVVNYLKTEGLLKNTMVIITGDHGEEFMENGNWGHNSEFTEQQIRVPLILWIPGESPQEIKHMTSHLDIPATLLPRLGVRNGASTYSLGNDLLGPTKRQHTLISGWARVAYVNEEIKAIFPISNRSMNRSYFPTKDDRPLTRETSLWSRKRGRMFEIFHNLRAFFQTKDQP
ncbi:MAG: sulfatase-like hydrolase/transferase, partial [Desulfobulbaceae bacterium]|nr:sulfatase-like hydrolase/transferase [Desulfobulbaceae bacterium]